MLLDDKIVQSPPKKDSQKFPGNREVMNPRTLEPPLHRGYAKSACIITALFIAYPVN